MMRITMNPGFLTEELIELGWEAQHIQMVYDRLRSLAEAGESSIDVAVRLNPRKRPTTPYVEPMRGPDGQVPLESVRQRYERDPGVRALTRA